MAASLAGGAAAPRPAGGSGEAAGPPLPFAVLVVACLSATAALPEPAAWAAALAAIVLLGVPHGALDTEVARPLLRPRAGRAWFAAFAVPYLALAAAVLVAWRIAPAATLAAFLAVSVVHFGEEDAGPGRPLEALARGGAPIALPVLLHPGETARVFAVAAGTPLHGVPGWLAGAALAWLALAPVACCVALARGRWRAAAETGLLGLGFAALPPLTAFALYFVCLHAPRHMAALAADPLLAPRVAGARSAALRSLPVTALTLLIGASLWPLYPGPPPERLLALTLQCLAALTLPHLLLGWGARWATAGRRR